MQNQLRLDRDSWIPSSVPKMRSRPFPDVAKKSEEEILYPFFLLKYEIWREIQREQNVRAFCCKETA